MLKVSNLSKTFGHHTILQNISFTWPSGTLGVAGHNGAGKSTLLSIIAGLTAPTRGSVQIQGLSPSRHKNLVSFAPSQLSFGLQFPVPFYLKALFRARAESISDERMKELLEEWNISSSSIASSNKDSSALVQHLSYGNLQKLNILQAYASQHTKVAIFDEPLNGLDNDAKRLVSKKLSELAQHKIVILVSHDLDHLHKSSDSILWLNRGQVIALENDIIRDLTTYQIIYTGQNQEHSNTVTESEKQEKIKSIVAQNGEITTIQEIKPSLSDIYQELEKRAKEC